MNQAKAISKTVIERESCLMQRARDLKKARENYLHAFFADPLANFLVHKLALSPWRTFFYCQIFVVVLYAIRSLLFFRLNYGPPALERFLIDFIYDFTLVPATYAYYIWISSRQGYVTYRLEHESALFARESNRSFSTKIHAQLNNPWLFRLAATLSFLLLLLHFVKLKQGAWIWFDAESDYFFFLVFKTPFTWIIPWYMAAVIFSKQIIFIWHIRTFLKTVKYNLEIIHRDQSAVLKPLSKYLLQFSNYMLICALGILLLLYRSIHFEYFKSDFLVHLAVILYLPACYYLFCSPLRPLLIRIKALADEMCISLKGQAIFSRLGLTRAMLTGFAFNLFFPVFLFFLICFT